MEISKSFPTGEQGTAHTLSKEDCLAALRTYLKRNHKLECQSTPDVIISFMQEKILIQRVNCSRAHIYLGT